MGERAFSMGREITSSESPCTSKEQKGLIYGGGVGSSEEEGLGLNGFKIKFTYGLQSGTRNLR